MVAHWIKTSMIDYPGRLASVVFLRGCQLRCIYCHNPHLIDTDSECDQSWLEVFDELKSRKALVDAVVVTGGEPTLDYTLERKLKSLKTEGFSVKLDTNGASPKVLTMLIENRLVDFVALDIKGSETLYKDQLGGTTQNFKSAMQCLEILRAYDFPYEVRTTVLKEHHSFEELTHLILTSGPVKQWVLQQCQGYPSYFVEELNDLKRHINSIYPETIISTRGIV